MTGGELSLMNPGFLPGDTLPNGSGSSPTLPAFAS